MSAGPYTGGVVRVLWPAAPLLVWGLHFGLVYGAHAYGCERGLDAGVVRVAVGVVTLLALLALVPFARSGFAIVDADGGEDATVFARWFAAAAALLAALAVLFQASPAFVLPACQ